METKNANALSVADTYSDDLIVGLSHSHPQPTLSRPALDNYSYKRNRRLSTYIRIHRETQLRGIFSVAFRPSTSAQARGGSMSRMTEQRRTRT